MLLAYPDFNKPFIIHTDASGDQLGAVISQDGRLIAFYSRKLNSVQKLYTMTERELLSIVETLKEYRNMLLGMRIVVMTDYKDLTHVNTTSPDRVMRWRLLLEEYGVQLRYIKGEHNIVADAFSRLIITKISRAWAKKVGNARIQLETLHQLGATQQESHPLDDDNSKHRVNYTRSKQEINETKLHVMFRSDICTTTTKQKVYATRKRKRGRPKKVTVPKLVQPNSPDFLVKWARLVKWQELDTSNMYRKAQQMKDRYYFEEFEAQQIVMKQGKIALTPQAMKAVIGWYHEFLLHPGMNCLYETINLHFTGKGLRSKVEDFVAKCRTCQLTKRPSKRYGKLPCKVAQSVPWQEINVDLMGPLSVTTPNGTIQLRCLTVIDPATYWVEIIDVS